MCSRETDRIAHEAARLIETGEAETLRDAIRLAAEGLGLEHAARPGLGRVRQHIRGMSMQAMGGRAYEEAVRGVMRQVEQLMTLVETTYDDARTVLVGRAAKGHVDGGAVAHIRIYTRRPLGELAHMLVELGYDEPEFETAHTRLGRLDRMRLLDDDVELVLTRLTPEMAGDPGRDLFTGRTVEAIDLPTLRRRIRDLRIS